MNSKGIGSHNKRKSYCVIPLPSFSVQMFQNLQLDDSFTISREFSLWNSFAKFCNKFCHYINILYQYIILLYHIIISIILYYYIIISFYIYIIISLYQYLQIKYSFTYLGNFGHITFLKGKNDNP